MQHFLLVLTLAAGVYSGTQPYLQPQDPQQRPHQMTAPLHRLLMNLGVGLAYGVEKEVKIGKCRQRFNLGQMLEGRSRHYPRCRY